MMEEQQTIVLLAAEDPVRGELRGDADAALQSNASQRAASPSAALTIAPADLAAGVAQTNDGVPVLELVAPTATQNRWAPTSWTDYRPPPVNPDDPGPGYVRLGGVRCNAYVNRRRGRYTHLVRVIFNSNVKANHIRSRIQNQKPIHFDQGTCWHDRDTEPQPDGEAAVDLEIYCYDIPGQFFRPDDVVMTIANITRVLVVDSPEDYFRRYPAARDRPPDPDTRPPARPRGAAASGDVNAALLAQLQVSQEENLRLRALAEQHVQTSETEDANAQALAEQRDHVEAESSEATLPPLARSVNGIILDVGTVIERAVVTSVVPPDVYFDLGQGAQGRVTLTMDAAGRFNSGDLYVEGLVVEEIDNNSVYPHILAPNDPDVSREDMIPSGFDEESEAVYQAQADGPSAVPASAQGDGRGRSESSTGTRTEATRAASLVEPDAQQIGVGNDTRELDAAPRELEERGADQQRCPSGHLFVVNRATSQGTCEACEATIWKGFAAAQCHGCTPAWWNCISCVKGRRGVCPKHHKMQMHHRTPRACGFRAVKNDDARNVGTGLRNCLHRPWTRRTGRLSALTSAPFVEHGIAFVAMIIRVFINAALALVVAWMLSGTTRR